MSERLPSDSLDRSAYDEMSGAFCAPFPPETIGWLPKGGKQFAYITARQVMNRLDEVVGLHNWEDEYSVHGNSVLCKLTVRFADGMTVTKQGVGANAGMDGGDDDKSGESDALKRAAVKLGIGRYLYEDGVPGYMEQPPVLTPPPAARGYNGGGGGVPRSAPTQPPARQTGGGGGGRYNKFSLPDAGHAFRWFKQMEEHFGVNMLDPAVDFAKKEGLPTDTRQWDQATTHRLCMLAVGRYAGLQNYAGEFDELIEQDKGGAGGDGDQPPWA